MLNQVKQQHQQSTVSDHIDYDVPPSTCGYPIYFSLCIDGHFERPHNRSPKDKSSPLTLSPSQSHSHCVNNNDDTITFNVNNTSTDSDQYKTTLGSAPFKGYDDISGNQNQNVTIPARDFNFNQLLRLSQQPNQNKNFPVSEQIYDVPRPYHQSPFSITKGKELPENNNVYPAQLVITTVNYETCSLPPTPPIPPHEKGLTRNHKSLSHTVSHEASPRSSLPRTSCDKSLTLPLGITKPISNFGSTSSLPSPIHSIRSMETSISFSSTNDNTDGINHSTNDGLLDNNRLSLGDQLNGSSRETYSSTLVKDIGKTGMDSGCCSNCSTLTPRGSFSGFQRQTGYNSPLIDEKNYPMPPSVHLINNNNQLTYDVPKTTLSRNNNNQDRCSSARPTKAITAITRSSISNASLSSSSSSLSSSNQFDNYNNNIDLHGLDLNLENGLILANRLEKESLEAIGKLIEISLIEGWRNNEKLGLKLTELTKLCSQLKCVIRELEVFTDGIYVNSLKTHSSINTKLYRLSRQLKDSAIIVISTIKSIDSRGWNLNELSINSNNNSSHDELDQLIACIPGLKEDIKHIMSLVKSSGNLLFPGNQVDKQQQQPTININNKNQVNPCLLNGTIGSVSSTVSKPTYETINRRLPNKPPPPPVPPKPPINLRPLPLVPKDNPYRSHSESTIQMVHPNLGKVTLNRETGSTEKKEDEYDEVEKLGNEQFKNNRDGDYGDDEDEDYATLETIKDKISRQNQFNTTYSHGSLAHNNEDIHCREQRDSAPFGDSKVPIEKLLTFYCPILEEYNQNLRTSVNLLISAINAKQEPNVLIGSSKLVVGAGKQMLRVAETINRNVAGQISCYIEKCSSSLCQSLKTLITNTKSALDLWPEASALQDLLDAIVQVSIHSDQLAHLKDQNF